VGGRPGGGSPLHARPAGLPPGRRGTGPARGVRRRPQPAEQAVHARGLGATGKGPQACRHRAAPILLLRRLSSTPNEGRGALAARRRLRAAQPCAPRPERRPAGAAVRAGRPGDRVLLHIDAQVRWRHLHSWGQLWRQQRSIRPRAAERPALRTALHKLVEVISCARGRRFVTPHMLQCGLHACAHGHSCMHASLLVRCRTRRLEPVDRRHAGHAAGSMGLQRHLPPHQPVCLPGPERPAPAATVGRG